MKLLPAALRRSPDAAALRPDPVRLRRLQWQVFVAITLGYGLYYVCRLSLNVVKKPLVDAGVFDTAQLGIIGSALFFAYAAGRLLHGVLVDHAHLRRYMALGLLASAVVNLALGFLPGFWLFVLLWGINGLVQSMGAPASIVSIANWWPQRGRGTVYGVWSTSHNIGEALTYIATAAVVTAFGATWGLWAAGLIGLLGGAMILALLRERPEVQGLPAPEATTAQAGEAAGGQTPQADGTAMPAGAAAVASSTARDSVAAAQWRAVRTPGVWLLALASGFFYVTRYAVNSWGVFFLQEAKAYSAVQAASIVSASAVAGIAGTFFSGLIADRVFGGRRHVPALLFGLLYVGATAWFVLGPASAWADTASMMLFGIAMGALLAYLGGMMAIDLVDKAAVGTATGIVGVASYLGAALQDLASGQLIHAGKSVVDGKAHYDFSWAGAVWIGAAVLSCLLALLVWPRKGRSAGPTIDGR